MPQTKAASVPNPPRRPVRNKSFPKSGVSIAALVLLGCGPALADELVSIPELESMRAATVKVEPSYPPMARQMRVTGRVTVAAAVDPEGNVERVEVLGGNALLSSACISAVRKWRFNPFQNDGKPARALVHLSFDFKL